MTGIVWPSSMVGRAGRAGCHVDEEVALEEQARTDLHASRPRGSAGRCPRSPSSRPPYCEPSMCSTLVTLPTSTPAMRTGESSRMLLTDLNTPLTSNCCCHGSDLLNARKVAIDHDDRRDQSRPHRVDPALEPADDDLLAWLCRARFHHLAAVFTGAWSSVLVPWLPGRLPIDGPAGQRISRYPPRTRASGPGPAVFGYGLTWR